MLDDRIINSKYQAERNLMNESFLVLSNLIFGSKNSEEKEKFVDFFNKHVKITFYNRTEETIRLLKNYYGVVYKDEEAGKINIELRGYEGLQANKLPVVKMTVLHELCHAFCDVFCLRNSYSVVKNGIEFKNNLGMVKQDYVETKKPVGYSMYGKFYNETMMDIITAIATKTKIEGGNLTVDDILSLNYRDWGCELDVYSPITSITRLTVAAFSNVASYKYQDIVNLGGSIFRGRVKKEGQKKAYLFNDFLYGIMCDPLHIDMVYDTYMGDGAFRDLSSFLDNIFKYQVSGISPRKEEIKLVMDKLQTFANLRVRDYYRKGIFTYEEFAELASKFNHIFRQMQTEYDAHFSKEEIDDITERAHKM